jgi:hypothetical protein
MVDDVKREHEIIGIIHNQICGAVAGAEIVVASTMRLPRGPEHNSRKRQDGQEQKPHSDRKRPR